MKQSRLFVCIECGDKFDPDWDESLGCVRSEKLCYYCFEDAVERAEERRRERIARANEY